jgi:hypothetical protein
MSWGWGLGIAAVFGVLLVIALILKKNQQK